MTVHNGLFQVDQGIGVSGGARQCGWTAVRRGLGSPGESEVGDAVVEFVREPGRMRAQGSGDGSDELGRVSMGGAVGAVDQDGQACGCGREHRRRRRGGA